jgi:zinc protease
MRFSRVFLASLIFIASAASFADVPYQIHKLKNGLDVITMESPKVPLVTIVLTSKAGAMTETPDINGLTHLWEHMFFKGNKRLPDQEAFNLRVRQLGILFNGDTSAEKVRYYFTLPAAFLDEGLQFMADAISTPLLEESELNKERKVVLDEYDRNASQPGFDSYRLGQKLLYGDASHLRNALGIRTVIENANRKQLLQIKEQVFVPENSALLVAGSFKTDKLLEIMNKHFADWKTPKRWKPPQQNTFPPFPQTTEYVMTRKEVGNAEFHAIFAGPKARSQPKESFAADILTSLLGVKSGKFYKKFIDSGLANDAGLNYYTQSQTGEVSIYASTSPDKIQKVKDALLAEIQEWAKPGYFTDDQLQDIRRALLISYKHELNKPSEYVKSLAFWWSVTGMEYYASYLDHLQKIELKDVREFVQTFLVKKPYVSSILLSPENAKKVGLTDSSEALMKKLNLVPGA